MTKLYGCYPPPDVVDPRILLSGAVAICQQYPISVVRGVCDPVHGLPATNKFAPNLAELRLALDSLDAPRRRREEREEAERAQLSERKQLQIEHQRPRKTYEQLQSELAEAGIFIGTQPKNPMDVGAFRTKFGISQGQWDAIPDAPK